jgi:hypothetical protein
LIGIDDVLSEIPVEWKSAGSDRGLFAADGVRFEMTTGGPAVLVGNLGRQILRAYQAGVAAAAHVGLNVIVDEVVIDRTSWDDWNVALCRLDFSEPSATRGLQLCGRSRIRPARLVASLPLASRIRRALARPVSAPSSRVHITSG